MKLIVMQMKMKISSFSTGNVKTNSERNIPFIILDFLLKPISVAHCSIQRCWVAQTRQWQWQCQRQRQRQRQVNECEWCESTEFNNERVEKDMAEYKRISLPLSYRTMRLSSNRLTFLMVQITAYKKEESHASSASHSCSFSRSLRERLIYAHI